MHPTNNSAKGNLRYLFQLTGLKLLFYSPDGRTLVFLSAKSAVDSGAHSATDSLHKMDWPADGKPDASSSIIDVVNS